MTQSEKVSWQYRTDDMAEADWEVCPPIGRFVSLGIDGRSPSTPEEAAEHIADTYHADWDYFSEIDVWIKDPEGIVTKFNVQVEPRPHFSAYVCEDPSP